MLHHAKIVADEQIGQIEPRAQIHEQIQYLRLDRDIQGGHGLIADQELRLHRQGTGDADALALAAGELMRIAALVGRVQARPGATAHPDTGQSRLG